MASKSTSSGQQTTKKPKELSTLAKIYLIVYNFGQVLGWCYLLYQLISYKLNPASIPTQTLWQYLGLTVIIFQNAAVLEIVHAAIGIVQSNVILTTFQVFSRVMVVCGVLLAAPISQLSYGLPLALFAWSVTEIIRYSYYGLNLINAVPYVLVWLRYTLFIALYPIGVTGELLCFFMAQSFARTEKMWTVELPNWCNFTFSYYYFLWTIMLLYIPLFPQLYLHMFAQRKKILGGGSKPQQQGTKKSK